jgi:hypothetical protein
MGLDYLAKEVCKLQPGREYVFAVGGKAYMARSATDTYTIHDLRTGDKVLKITPSDLEKRMASVQWKIACLEEQARFGGRFYEHGCDSDRQISQLPRYCPELSLFADALMRRANQNNCS